MRRNPLAGFAMFAAALALLNAFSSAGAAQAPAGAPGGAQAMANLPPVPLEWTPEAYAQLSAAATSRTSFTLDRTMLAAAGALVPDADLPTRQAIQKLDGVSVHLLRFGDGGVPDEDGVNAVRKAYHLRGWKHVITSTDKGGPVHSSTTDVWFVLDGANVRGAVILAETPRSLTLVSVSGNLNPVDILHLRGHFGIPKFDGDALPPQ